MITVSVIIPVYDVAQYVFDCVNSVLRQSYSDLEIIIINDGSTDNSGTICKQCASQDQRVKYYEKKNEGLSSARNYGLIHATGDLIYFLDADDFLAENAIEALVEELISSKSDIVSSAFTMVNESEESSSKTINADFIRGDNSLFYLQRITNHACAKLYRKELFDGISYPVGRHYEDVATTFRLYNKAARVSHTDSGMYFYRMRAGAITNSISNQDIEDMWYAFDSIKDSFEYTTKNQLFYEVSVLYSIYSRLLRSNCTLVEFKDNEKRVYDQLDKLDFVLNDYKGKTKMYFKLRLFEWHLTKYLVPVIDFLRKISRNKALFKR